MSKHTMFSSIEREELTRVNGGAARVAATDKGSDLDSKLQLMLTQIGDSIKQVGKSNNGNDQLMPLMMMMMMGGSSGGSAPPPAPPPQPSSFVRVNVKR